MNKALIISIDDFKNKIPGYNPSHAEKFHSQSAKLADKEFELQLKISKFSKVILVGGGSASGKTELISSYLFNEHAIVFDSTLSSPKGLNVKIKKILKSKKEVEIIYVIPEDLKSCYVAFLKRDRKLSDKIFYNTHVGCRKSLLWILENYANISTRVIASEYNNEQKRLMYSELLFDSENTRLNYAKNIQLTEEHINKIIIEIKNEKKRINPEKSK